MSSVCEDRIYYREVLFVKIGLLLGSLDILIYVKTTRSSSSVDLEQQPLSFMLNKTLHKNRSAFLEMKSAENSLNGEY